jgi:hypothetical protein
VKYHNDIACPIAAQSFGLIQVSCSPFGRGLS